MKILLSSHFFYPSLGGIEEVSNLLAREFVAAGHTVTVVTQSEANLAEGEADSFPFEIRRRPHPGELLRVAAWCDVFLHNNISLQTAWPLLGINRPWVIAHHTWLRRADGTISWRDRLKQRVAQQAWNIAVSEAIKSHLDAPAVVIGNPYRDAVFRCDPKVERDHDLVFLGRLVTDKGLDLLFQALAVLRSRGVHPSLTVIGSGPEEANLQQLAAELGITGQVDFVGARIGAELAALLNRHRLIVVPSRWQEPFGLAALEGIACGCVALVSQSGGLPDAIGACGRTFRHGDAGDLAQRLEELLDHGADLSPYRVHAPAHLAQHTASAVAARYLKILEEAAGR